MKTYYWIGIGGAAALALGYIFWPKTAKAASPTAPPPAGGGGTTPPAAPPPSGGGGMPSWWPTWLTTPPTVPPVTTTPPAGWKLPPGWVPPAGWVPPWASPTTPKEAGAVSDDYKMGFNAGMLDAAGYPGKSMTPIPGANQDTSKYASSPSYKSGYDQAWHDYMSSVSTAGVGAAVTGCGRVGCKGTCSRR